MVLQEEQESEKRKGRKHYRYSLRSSYSSVLAIESSCKHDVQPLVAIAKGIIIALGMSRIDMPGRNRPTMLLCTETDFKAFLQSQAFASYNPADIRTFIPVTPISCASSANSSALLTPLLPSFSTSSSKVKFLEEPH